MEYNSALKISELLSHEKTWKSFIFFSFFKFFYFFTFVLVLPYINMNPSRVHTWSPSWTALPPPSPYHPSGSSQCTSPKLPVSCMEPGLAIHFLYDIIHVLMPFSQIIPPSLSHRVQKTVLYICVSFAVSQFFKIMSRKQLCSTFWIKRIILKKCFEDCIKR